MRVDAILSDYDGTLSPTASINSKENAIPEDIENILWDISEMIPVCILSSKDFDFLHRRTRFANVTSCIMGIETLVLRRHKVNVDASAYFEGEAGRTLECQDLGCIKDSYLMDPDNILQYNSQILYQLAELVRANFNEIRIDRKFTVTNKKVLAGITLDWRHMDDWKIFRTNSEPQLKEMIIEKQNELGSKQSNIYVQTYSTHPFIDIYSITCNKGMAYDRIISMIPIVDKKLTNVIYLGDSENDNPGFRKATIAVGVQSYTRLKPNLDCKYNLHISKLSIFLKNLLMNRLEFSPSLITM
ncbi:MAG: HAD hydrolase family protein [Nitrososphaeraceae archaeon]